MRVLKRLGYALIAVIFVLAAFGYDDIAAPGSEPIFASFRLALAEAQRPWLMGAAGLLLCVAAGKFDENERTVIAERRMIVVEEDVPRHDGTIERFEWWTTS